MKYHFIICALLLSFASEATAQQHQHETLITDKYVVVHGDVIPRFGANAEFIAIRSGNWSDASIWNRNRMPGADAKVQIPANISVVYDQNSRTQIDAIEISGQLSFSTSTNTVLAINEIMVMPTGTLSIGSAQQPLPAHLSAEIVFTDTPGPDGLHFKTGTVEAPGIDPQQWGKGLIVLGAIQIHGTKITSSYVNLLQEPLAGQQSLTLATAPVGWKPGDQLVLPDTEPAWRKERVEDLVVQSVQGKIVNLQSPLKYTHRGAHLADGTLKYLPDVGNLSRNITFRSENPRGVRGHTVCFGAASVDIRYARFSGLGRTEISALDNALVLFDKNNLVVSKIGHNQIGRYSLHMHHVEGPQNPTNTGNQFKLVGNTVDDGKRWGVVVHGSNYGQIADNLVYNVIGAGIVTEDGSESFNHFDNNFVVKTTGNGFFKEGLAGESFWFRGPLNLITNNVAANANRAGFDIFEQNLPKNTPKPRFRGADKANPDQTVYHQPSLTPWLGFENNRVYSSEGAFDSWLSTPASREYLADLTVWHTNDNFFTLSSYANKNVYIDGLSVIGDFKSLKPQKPQIHQPITSFAIQAVRESSNLVVDNSSILGAQIGITTPAHRVEKMTVRNSEIQAYRGIDVRSLTIGGPHNSAPDLDYGSLTIENTKFIRMPENAKEPKQYTLYLKYDLDFRTRGNLMAKSEIFLYDFNGIPGANYQVYYLEQAPDFIVPTTVRDADPRKDFIASPEPNLTNQQVWEKYGVALAGAVAPCKAFDNDNCQAARARAASLSIQGLVFPILKAPPMPVVNAGADVLGVQYKPLKLSGLASPGTVGDWSKFSGPGEAIFSNHLNAASTVTFSEPGSYILRFTGTLGNRRAFDDVTVSVSPN